MNRRPLVVGVGGAMAVLLAWYAFLWSPQTKALTKQRAAAAAAEKQLSATRTAAIRQRAASRDEPAQRAQLDLLRAAIPDAPAVGQFILDTNDAAAKAGVTLTAIAPRAAGGRSDKTSAATPGLISTPVTVTAQGSYPQVVEFLGRLEKLPRMVVIDSVSATAGNGGARVSLTVTARMFSTGVGT
jgi:Tfp pilus assembly protein PilO